jgi:hypothetical protein
MTEVFTNIVNLVPKKYKLLIKHGILVLPINLVLTDYINRKQELISTINSHIGSSENSMHKYTSINPLSKNDIDSINNIIWPFVREYYELWDKKSPNYFGGFSIIYNDKFEKNLANHVDDSLYTINMCIKNDNCDGSEIIFNGSKSNHFSKSYDSRNKFVIPEEDYMIIHLGKHPHQTNNIINGERINIVMWYK